MKSPEGGRGGAGGWEGSTVISQTQQEVAVRDHSDSTAEGEEEGGAVETERNGECHRGAAAASFVFPDQLSLPSVAEL